LGGNRGSKYQVTRNTFIIFLVCGLWHGANWTFIFWGFINALYFLPLLLLGKNKKNMDIVAQGKTLPSIKELLQMGTTFVLATLAWIFFRADSIGQAFSYIGKIFSKTLMVVPYGLGLGLSVIVPSLTIMVIVEWLQREKAHGLEDLKIHFVMRWAIYLVITSVIILFGAVEKNDFIYFQF
jgi:D-alanyl-lipoteichoic acid acyltransferase DltB (MBOAT superfamily)